ncbi:hypothetical protein NQ318_011596 [Aromia moschata]|uniref:Uncharacterized protein n=1 Tax=Aromia moschata TaxID=1265417 RepID=A0AAV8Z9R9_9CUCU|nr:hypothetical protein NQ318_011596 [Aromia moschata]
MRLTSVNDNEASNQSTQLFTAPLEADIFEPVALYSERPQFGLLSSRLLGVIKVPPPPPPFRNLAVPYLIASSGGNAGISERSLHLVAGDAAGCRPAIPPLPCEGRPGKNSERGKRRAGTDFAAIYGCIQLKQTHPDLPPLSQGTISKIEAQCRKMGHVRKVPSKRQAVVDDDTKLNLLLTLEENPITPARQLARDMWIHTASGTNRMNTCRGVSIKLYLISHSLVYLPTSLQSNKVTLFQRALM